MAHYLDDAQCKALMRRARSWLWCSECPTWLLIVAVHTSRFGIALHATQLGLLATTTLLTLATCEGGLHGSHASDYTELAMLERDAIAQDYATLA
ncbi:hypothetical protein VSR69_43415 [Paraburkholderia phytofirmans]